MIEYPNPILESIDHNLELSFLYRHAHHIRLSCGCIFPAYGFFVPMYRHELVYCTNHHHAETVEGEALVAGRSWELKP